MVETAEDGMRDDASNQLEMIEKALFRALVTSRRHPIEPGLRSGCAPVQSAGHSADLPR
jgi:hypothetical protein